MGVTLNINRKVLWFQSEGTLLATGSYDGFARIWTKDGKPFPGTAQRTHIRPQVEQERELHPQRGRRQGNGYEHVLFFCVLKF